MDWIQVIVLSLIQGITEFLPISSSAHLILPGLLTEWPDQGLAFDVAVHFGTLVAVVAYFRGPLLTMVTSVTPQALIRRPPSDKGRLDEARRNVLLLIVATLPVVGIGVVSKDFVASNLRTLPVITAATLLFAGMLWYADRRPGTRATLDLRDALIIGLAQAVALIPGTSRSGITITAALLLGISRVRAAEFSFLLAIPTIAGAQLLLTLDLVSAPNSSELLQAACGALIAGISAYLGIHFFIRLVNVTGMLPYVVYRVALGLTLLGVMVFY